MKTPGRDWDIGVYAGWLDADAPQLIGKLRSSVVRGKEVFAFKYDASWLAANPSTPLDPELQLHKGSQYVAGRDQLNFGVFLDSSPDRWGRTLMRRREALLARREKRTPRPLTESDFLLGVHDPQRLGGLRFALEQGGPFLSDDDKLAAPPWTSLRSLEAASWKVQDEETTADDAIQEKWLRLLMAPGSSLGGARPKAGVVDASGHLWIGKFPAREDEWDAAAWEMLLHELAQAAGIEVPRAKLERFGRKHRTFLVQRFDRLENGGRRHFASAMTLLGQTDGAGADSGVSYLDLAAVLMRSGSRPQTDLPELWRRMVFSICVSNTDDHLHNHGFLLTQQGWQLSPAYDLNPNPDGQGLSLNITEADNALDLDLAREVAPHFRLKPKEVEPAIQRIRDVVAQWPAVAQRFEIPRSEQSRMATAFRA